MNGWNVMLHTPDTAEARRALLAKYLRGGLAQETRDAIPCHASDEPAPLSFGQQQLWLLAQLVPDEPVYNECVTIHLPGPLDIAVFERSFNEIIRRHEAWRTSFPLVDGQPVQMVHPPVPVTLPVVDLRSLPASEREAEALRLATEDARILFDMAQGPLLRAKLIRLDEQEHRLFLTLHHIIFDGVAIYQVFLPELRAIYEAFLADRPSPLPPASIKYTDYAWWQRAWLEKEVFADQMAYWHQQLAGVTAALELPTDRPRPAVETYHGSMFPFSLSKELTNALQMLAGQEGATLYMVLVAAFKTLLYRYTGQEDMLVGTATAGRKRAQLERLMGFCLSTVVLRTDLSGDPTFRELLKRVREVVATACANDDIPFEYVVKELQPDRYLDHNPLFQVLMTLEPPLPVLASGWTLTQMDVKTGTSKFDLSLELDNRPEGLIGRFEFNTDLFDESTIARLIGHWKTLLEGIVADPTRRLSELPLLLPTEYHQLLEAWNATQADYPRKKCIHQLFEEQVAQTPDALAVIFAQTQLTYRELNERANRLAHRLIEIGVGPDALVGLCVERSLDMIVGMLAILKAGGAYVPLDPTYPGERLSYMLEDSRATVLVTQRHLLERLAPGAIQPLCIDAEADELARQPDANPVVPVASDHLAYVIYTSGSTGRPKGVQIPHRAVVNFLTSMRQEPGLQREETLLAVTTLSFDIAALELLLPLLVGARLVIAGSEIVSDGAALAGMLSSQHVTVMQATPVTWRLLLASG
ncbi:MAG TPA: condensation domain-containing protein, partial [Ktedonobacteraceae bacterium]|nr:condensation domain-containing protein [Ktedonobacteraceae bacterium]